MYPKIVEHIETDHRIIKTKIPCEGTQEVMRVLEKYESRAMQGQMPLVWDYAEGHSVYDLSKNKWIDFHYLSKCLNKDGVWSEAFLDDSIR